MCVFQMVFDRSLAPQPQPQRSPGRGLPVYQSPPPLTQLLPRTDRADVISPLTDALFAVSRSLPLPLPAPAPAPAPVTLPLSRPSPASHIQSHSHTLTAVQLAESSSP